MKLRELAPDDCMELVRAGRLARLACCRDDRPYVVPIHYGVDGNVLYSFTMPGRKLDMMRANPFVCLEIDKFDHGHEWTSVVVDGVFRELENEENRSRERIHAWSLLQLNIDWWEPGAFKPQQQPVHSKSPHVFFAIEISAVSGRHASKDDS
ncbi:pyridoxamine 5'-phosphate oxidase family protein [Rhizobium herbae]|uniref:Nitroimidazol reductase NimA-like FMN-containing flavoprotein (Pyridoxamine 5'-phosphate oxidase superfamily) n=1 Tax=Rhizobium herbae TaxID=508661 RepID=A0ABS4EPQ7_9HYPH|nr:pyridoxamine 5'-phosphate oxidase family protein [Rhizobium herbae]MBP1859922.1 nitroimidazol reductase NimA-like FMN-containing flavoprotein (pyridoxamine 5'-phosphate oxidase superfamily) [Rhizobium herbae]